MPTRVPARVSAACLAAAVTFVAVPASGDGGDPAFFAARYGTKPNRVVVGTDGTVYLGGTTPYYGPSGPPPYVQWTGLTWHHFVTALAPDGTERWTTFLGDTSEPGSERESLWALAAAPDGSVWAGGSGDIVPVRPFPLSPPADGASMDSWIAKLSRDGEVVSATGFHGAGGDAVSEIAVDAAGRAFVVGSAPPAGVAGLPDSNWSGVFVWRVAADASQVDWVRRAGISWNSSGGVAVGPDGTVYVTLNPDQRDVPEYATATHLDAEARVPRADRFWEAPRLLVVERLADDGHVAASASLDFVGAGGTPPRYEEPYHDPGRATHTPVAVAPDGTVVVAGDRAVARLSPNLDRIEAVGTRPAGAQHTSPARIAMTADGRAVVLGTGHDWEDPERWPTPVDVYAPGLTAVRRLDFLGRRLTDIALDAQGSLHAVANRAGLPFNEPAASAGPGGAVVAKVPLDGAAVPSRVRARAAGPHEVDISWRNDGDPAASFEVERLLHTDEEGGRPFFETGAPVLAAQVAGTAGSVRVSGLDAGTKYFFRVVAVFPSGVRTGTGWTSAATTVLAPSDFAVTTEDDRFTRLTWDIGAAAHALTQLQRRTDSGPWTNLGRNLSQSTLDNPPHAGSTLTYRIRSVLGRDTSPWVESEPVEFARTLLVRQVSGAFRYVSQTDPYDATFEFQAEGAVAPVRDGAPLAFDPEADLVSISFGPSPDQRTLLASAGGWTRQGDVFTWRDPSAPPGADFASSVLLDLEHGRFELVHRAKFPAAFRSRTVQVELTLAGRSGGEERVWRGSAARGLELGPR